MADDQVDDKEEENKEEPGEEPSETVDKPADGKASRSKWLDALINRLDEDEAIYGDSQEISADPGVDPIEVTTGEIVEELSDEILEEVSEAEEISEEISVGISSPPPSPPPLPVAPEKIASLDTSETLVFPKREALDASDPASKTIDEIAEEVIQEKSIQAAADAAADVAADAAADAGKDVGVYDATAEYDASSASTEAEEQVTTEILVETAEFDVSIEDEGSGEPREPVDVEDQVTAEVLVEAADLVVAEAPVEVEAEAPVEVEAEAPVEVEAEALPAGPDDTTAEVESIDVAIDEDVHAPSPVDASVDEVIIDAEEPEVPVDESEPEFFEMFVKPGESAEDQEEPTALDAPEEELVIPGPDDEDQPPEEEAAAEEDVDVEVEAAAEEDVGVDVEEEAEFRTDVVAGEEPEEAEESTGLRLSEAIQDATGNDPHRLMGELSRELEHEQPKSRKALLHHELGHIAHFVLKNESQAAKAYAQALNMDPLLWPNVWAIGRIFISRGLWSNLIKLYDAQYRFEEDSQRQAEVLLEKGWLQLEKLDDKAGAKESFWAAYKANEEWLLPLLALEKICVTQGDNEDLAQVYRHMAETAEDPTRKSRALIELARLQDQLSDGTPQVAMRLLERALEIVDDKLAIMGLMEDVAFDHGLHEDLVDLLSRQADLLLGQQDPDKLGAVARLRQAAQIANDQLGNAARAQELLETSLDIIPNDPLLQRDLLAIAEQRGDGRQVTEILGRQLATTQDERLRAALHFRIGLAQHREDKTELPEAINEALDELPGYLPALVEKERHLLKKGDLRGIVDLYLTEAEAIEQRSPGLPLEARADPQWQATALWSASIILCRHLDEPQRSIELCQQALDIKPDFQPALDLLEELYRRTEQHEKLADLLDQQSASATGQRAVYLLESLAALSTGPLNDPQRLLVCLKRLRQQQPDNRLVTGRLTEILLRLERFEELDEVLRELDQAEEDEAQQISWKLLRAHLFEGPLDRPDEAVKIYLELLEQNPTHQCAFVAAEYLLIRSSRFEDLSNILRRAADDTLDQERKSALLDSLGAVYSRMLHQPARATDTYAELLELRPNDLAAARNLARAAADADNTEKLVVALEAQIEHAASDAAKLSGLIRLSEILEDKMGDAAQAEEMMRKAIDLAPSREQVADIIDALARRQLSRGDFAEAAENLGLLQDEVPEEAKRRIVEEQAWLRAGPLDDAESSEKLFDQLLELDPDNITGLWGKLRLAAHRRQPADISSCTLKLSGATSDPWLAASLKLRSGLFANAAGEESKETYGEVLDSQPDMVEALVALLAEQNLDPQQQADLSIRLAELAPLRLREEMRLSLALILEKAGRLKDAQQELGQILKKDSDHLAALIAFQRLVQATGDKENEARIWIRLAGLLKKRSARAEAYTRAGELLLELGNQPDAAILFRQVLHQAPDDSQAFEKLHQLYQDQQDSVGLEALLTHRLQHTENRGDRISLHFERAELRSEKLDDRKGAATDLAQILQHDPKHLEALRQLARLYDEDNNPGRALELYNRYVEAADSLSLRRPVVIRIAELLHYEKGRTADAVDICRKFLESSPEDEKMLELMVDFYIKLRDFPRAIESLERLCNMRDDRQWRAQYQLRIGTVYWKQMKDLPEARTILMRGRDIDPANIDIVDSLRHLNKEMSLDQDTKRLLDCAKDDLREVLANQPVSVENYKKLMKLAEWGEDTYTLLASMGVLCYFNAADGQDQELYNRRMAKTTFEPKRFPSGQTWRDTQVVSAAKSAYGEIWSVIAPAVPLLFEQRVAGDPATLGVGRSEKVDRKAGGPVSNTLDRMAKVFGLSEFDIFLSQNKPDIVAGVTAERSALVVGHSVVTSMNATQRFRIGRTLSLMRDKAFALELLDRHEIARVILAAVYLYEPGASLSLPRGEVEGESRKLQKVLSRRARKALPLAVARFMQEAGDLDQWIDAVLATANRAGLLICGDLLVAMSQIVEQLRSTSDRSGKTTAEIARIVGDNSQAAQLLVYSVSRDYLDLRRELQV